VWLNAASSLRFATAFTGKERAVELSGEAYFQVTKNSSMPFKVAIVSPAKEPVQIEVLGTELNVEAYADEQYQKTTLINGSIKVVSHGHEVLLDPGQQALLNSSLNVLSNVNIEEITAWKNGLFQFQDASIESIMRQVGRWYDVEIVYKGKVDQQFIGKIPRQVKVSTLLKILESTGWVHFMIEGKKITVAP
ncbi:MAG: FecR domain-containing protein, partial [Bacteroidota bacterium]